MGAIAAIFSASARADDKLQFNRDIRPIFSDNCFSCHGIDAKKREAKLRLDTAEGAYKANEDGVFPIKPGDLAKSDAWERISSNDKDEIMPPPKSHKKLTAAQKDTIKRWIEQGAPYQKHWAFEVPVLPPVPVQMPVLSAQSSVLSGSQRDGAPGAEVPLSTEHLELSTRNPIDAFIAQRLEKEQLKLSPEADRSTLLRRVTFDLTGLPPTPAEADAFLADQSPDAYDKVVARLLASPRYGEQMGRYWLDQARYGDTHGLHLDNERSMWPYRDWVVAAYNRNLPFDQFTIEQLAGDLLPNPTQEQLVATGFNRCNVTTSEGGSIDAEYVFRYAVDRTATTMNTWMALTGQCAVCHDHKFDPISQKEFYQLYAFFVSAADPPMDGNKLLTPPILQLATPEQQKTIDEFDQKIAATETKIRAAIADLNYVDPATQSPAPPVQTSELVWFEDGFPEGAKVESVGDPTTFVTKDTGPVFSGERALKRTAKDVAQDFFNGGTSFDIPANGKISVECFIDPDNLPKAVMIQFYEGSWNHRAVWGLEGAIPYGKVRTPEHVVVGDLPKPGEWVKLEVASERLGLKPGMKVTGYAFTQAGGTVYWDQLVMSSRVDPKSDPQWSWSVWVEKNQGKKVDALPNDLQTLVRDKKAAEWTEAETKRLQNWWFENEYQGARSLVEGVRAEKLALESKKKALEDTIPSTFIMKDMEKPRDAFIMVRGQYDKPGDKVERAVPAAFAPLPNNPPSPTRLDLARWLVAPENPLTARVTVNRLWQQFFGTGLVKTSGDFGSQGEPPSHPELLDWLAVTFRESGWDVKNLVHLIVTSATYGQSSQAAPDAWKRDPENRLLARGPRFRLDAEEIRDNALYVSGLLREQMGGRAVKTYQPPNIWEPVGFGGSNTRFYRQDSGDALYRRSIYCFIKRTAPAPFMTTFDAPSREQFCTRRERSDTPLQALELMNDVQHFEAARALAERILREGGTSTPERIAFGFRTVLARPPTEREAAITCGALDQHLARYQADPAAAKAAISNGETKPDPKLAEPELAAWTLVANLLLNLDETVTKN
jgi:mono/diheme cytochrome c family protein